MNMQELKKLIYQGEKVDIECKKSEDKLSNSIYESYSAFANTKGGIIILGIKEDKTKTRNEERFIFQGIKNPSKQIEDFWNTVNSKKVNVSILKDEDVYIVEEDGLNFIVINVPRADFNSRPVYVGENPYTGTFKRNHEGDYHATQDEVNAMIRDKNIEGNDNTIIEYYDMNDIDKETLKKYRQIFEVRNEGHVWNSFDDKRFLEELGGYRKDRKTNVEGLTLAGLLMFGTGRVVREKFDNIFMDYRDQSDVTEDIRWNDRITYDGTWENNLFNFFMKVTPKLLEDLKKPFKLDGLQSSGDTAVHKAVREGFVNLIIHADYLRDAGVLKVIKYSDGFEFTNPGTLKLSVEEIFRGGNSKTRNPHMQTMLRMIGFGDNAGSGFPTIIGAWEKEGWAMPELIEDTNLNQVTLKLSMKPSWLVGIQELEKQLVLNLDTTSEHVTAIGEALISSIDNLSSYKIDGIETALKAFADGLPKLSNTKLDAMYSSLKTINNKFGIDSELAFNARRFAELLSEKSAKKLAEKSAEKISRKNQQNQSNVDNMKLSKRQKQILEFMELNVEYSTKEIAAEIGIKEARTRQILNELVDMGLLRCTAATKKRRYIKII